MYGVLFNHKNNKMIPCIEKWMHYRSSYQANFMFSPVGIDGFMRMSFYIQIYTYTA